MKKVCFQGVACLCLSVFMSFCAVKTKSEFIVVDVVDALSRVKPLKMSEMIDRIEYIKLETKPEFLIGYGQAVKVGDFLYVKNNRPVSLLVFDQQGKFVRQISRQGKGPGEYVNFTYFDVSQDNRLIAIGGFGGGIRLYTTDGLFKQQCDFSSPFFSGFRFLNSTSLITHEARTNVDQKGFPMLLAWDTQQLRADTLLRLDLKPAESDLVFPLAYTPFYEFDGKINFMEAANDTLYQLDGEQRISPRMVFECGEQEVTEANIFKTPGKSTIRIFPFCETNRFIVANSNKGDESRILVFNKKTAETFCLPVKQSSIDKTAKTFSPENDLEGIDFTFNGLKTNDQIWTSVLQITDLKTFFESAQPDQLNLKTRKYFDELRRLTAESDVNDNPIVRVIYLK